MTIHVSVHDGLDSAAQARMTLTPIAAQRSAAGPDPTFKNTREWTRHYVLHSFAHRRAHLGSIESHPDFE